MIIDLEKAADLLVEYKLASEKESALVSELAAKASTISRDEFFAKTRALSDAHNATQTIWNQLQEFRIDR